VEEANSVLAASIVAGPVAKEIARTKGRRGLAGVEVAEDGTVLLTIRPLPEDGSRADKRWTSDLPPLEVLRERAKAVGVDISHLGRQRAAINAVVEEAERQAATGKAAPRKKMMKTGPAVGPVTVVHDPAPPPTPEPEPAKADPPPPPPEPGNGKVEGAGLLSLLDDLDAPSPAPKAKAPEPPPPAPPEPPPSLADLPDEPEAAPEDGPPKKTPSLKSLAQQSKMVDLDRVLEPNNECPPEDEPVETP
jgi:hypothetical protein